MFIELSYTEPGTLTPHPNAALVISNVRLTLEPPSAEFELALYHDAAALHSGALPFETRAPSAFTVAEIAALRDQFAVAVATVLLQRDEFKSGTAVQ